MSDRYTRRIYLATAEGRDLTAEEHGHLETCDACQAAVERGREFERTLYRELSELRAPMPADPGRVREARRGSLLPLALTSGLAVLVLLVGLAGGNVATPNPSPAPSSLASLPTPRPTANPVALGAGTYASVAVDGLELHDDVRGEPFAPVPSGFEVFVLHARDGWYFVQAPHIATADYLFGWVPGTVTPDIRTPTDTTRPAEDGEGESRVIDALRPREQAACPPLEDLDPAFLGGMHPQRILECFGDVGQVQMEGYAIEVNAFGGEPAYDGQPEWLARVPTLWLSSVVGPAVNGGQIAIHVPPELNADIPISDREAHDGVRLTVTGHFDDPRAVECFGLPTDGSYPLMSDVLWRMWCQQQFVVDSVALTEPSPSPAPEPTSEGVDREYAEVARTESDGITVTLEMSAIRGDYGDRTWGRVTVENIGDDNVYWQAGGCGFVASIDVVPDLEWRLQYGREWPDDPQRQLKSVLLYQTPETSSVPVTTGFTPEAVVDFEGAWGCTSDWQLGTMAPGEVTTFVGAWDHDAMYDMPAPIGTYRITARFPFYGRGSEPPPHVANLPADTEELLAETDYEVAGAAHDLLDPGPALDIALSDPAFIELANSTQTRWTGGEIVYVDGVWEIRWHLGGPDETIVALVDARSGVLLDVITRPRTEPGG